MRVGDRVAFITPDGERHTSTLITAVSGTGKSGYKKLDLEYKGETVADVPHGKDRVEGEPYWLLTGEKDERPEEEDDEERGAAEEPPKKPKKEKRKK
jgi:hypothetical protein